MPWNPTSLTTLEIGTQLAKLYEESYHRMELVACIAHRNCN